MSNVEITENNEIQINNCGYDEFSPSFADLPMEIIIKIFRYLNFVDIQLASQTCRRWLHASQNKEFQKLSCVNFSKICIADNLEPITRFLHSFRKFHNLNLSQCEFGIIEKFFSTHGPYIEELILDTLDLNEKEFISILKETKNLKSLHIINCSSLFMAGQFLESITIVNIPPIPSLITAATLPSSLISSTTSSIGNYDKEILLKTMSNIRLLSLKANSYLSDMILLRITSLIPKIECLDLSGCHIAYHTAIQRRFYPSLSSSTSTSPSLYGGVAGGGGGGADNNSLATATPSAVNYEIPSESILTFKYILHVIRNYVKTLRELNLSSTLFGGQALIALSEVKGLNLRKLHLRYCRQLNQIGLQNIFETQQNLQYLDVSYSLYITDICLEIIIENLQSLEVLKLRKCVKLTNQSVIRLNKLKKLQILDLSHCDSITSDGITNGIAKEKNLVLIELYLTSIDLCELCMIRCSENLLNLRVFDVGCCVNGVTDRAVQSIIKNLIWLRVLNLEGCSLITDASITGIDITSRLEKTSLTNSYYSNKDDNLTNFGSDCSSCDIGTTSQSSSIHENSPGIMIPVTPSITTTTTNHLRISLRSKAEEEIYQDAQRKKAMLAICEMNNYLNYDNVDGTDGSNCGGGGGDELTATYEEGLSIKQLKGLQTLNLRNCNKISDISLKYGLKFLELRKLYLSNCQQISIIGISALVKNCKSIEEIDLADCHNINDKCIECITKHLKRLRSLDISGCTQLTDYSLDYIVLNCKVLQKLSVHRCRRMCSDIDLRLSTLSSLRMINMDRSSNIENADIIRMKKHVPPWNY